MGFHGVIEGSPTNMMKSSSWNFFLALRSRNQYFMSQTFRERESYKYSFKSKPFFL